MTPRRVLVYHPDEAEAYARLVTLLRALADKRIAGAMLRTTCGATSQAGNSAT